MVFGIVCTLALAKLTNNCGFGRTRRLFFAFAPVPSRVLTRPSPRPDPHPRGRPHGNADGAFVDAAGLSAGKNRPSVEKI